jgi:YD repeat-containing protein
MERDDNSSSSAFLRRIIERYAAIRVAATSRTHHRSLNGASRVFAHFALSILCSLLLTAWPLVTHAVGAQFVYDPAGRLVQVIAPDGTSAQYTYDPAGNLLAVTPMSASTAAVTGFSNAGGATGSTLTIYGSGFSAIPANNTVSFNGVLATVVSSTANTLTVTVPSDAISGPVIVTDSNGTVTSTSNFVVADAPGAPSITSFSPLTGRPGDTVTINGSNFQNSAGTHAYFAATAGVVESATASALTASVSAGSTSGRLSVVTAYGTTIGATDFFVAPANRSVWDIDATARLAIDGAPVTLSIHNAGNIGMVVFDGVGGQVVKLEVLSQTFPSSCGSGKVSLNRPGPIDWWIGNIGVASFCPGASSFTLPVTGTYTLVVSPSWTDAGNLTMAVISSPIVSGPIQIDGNPVTVTTAASQQAQLTFATIQAAQVINLQVSGSTYPSGCSEQSLTVLGPAPAITQQYSGNLCGTQPLELAAIGKYTITVTPYGTDTGSATVQLMSVAPVVGPIYIDGAPVTVTTTVSGQQAQLTFTSTSPTQAVTIQPTSDTYPSWCGNQALTLTGPAPVNAVLLRKDLCTTRAVILPTVGNYAITVIPYNTDTGSVTIQLRNAPTIIASIAIDGSPVTLTTTLPAQQAQLTFTSSSANQVVSFQQSGCTFNDCGDALLMVTGPPPANTYVDTVYLYNAAQAVTLRSIGTYTVTLIPYDTDSGSLTLRLHNVPTITGF